MREPEGLALAGQMLLQGVTFIGVTALVFGAVAWGAGTMADRLRSPAFQTMAGQMQRDHFRFAGHLHADYLKFCFSWSSAPSQSATCI